MRRRGRGPPPPRTDRIPLRPAPNAGADDIRGETPITPFLAAYYVLSLVAVVVAWTKGGHPERLGALAMVVVFAVSFWTHGITIDGFYVGDAVIDLLLTVFFVWMALTRDRWWPLIMSGVMGLTLLVYLTGLLVPDLSAYAMISARVGLGIVTVLTLLAGTGERWLSGEQAVSDLAAWKRRRAGEPQGSSPSRSST